MTPRQRAEDIVNNVVMLSPKQIGYETHAKLIDAIIAAIGDARALEHQEQAIAPAMAGHAAMLEQMQKANELLTAALGVPEGCVRLPSGEVCKVLGELQITADRCVAGHNAEVWINFGRVGHSATEDLIVMKEVSWFIPSTRDICEAWTTREAALASRTTREGKGARCSKCKGILSHSSIDGYVCLTCGGHNP